MTALKPDTRIRFLAIFLLANLAFAQPLFDLFGRQAEFLVAHQLSGARLYAFAIGLGIAAPAMLAGLVILARRLDQRTAHVIFSLAFVSLSALVLAPAFSRAGFSGLTFLVLVTFCALAALFTYYRFQAVRLFFQVFALAVPVLLYIFLSHSRAEQLLDTNRLADTGPGLELRESPDIIFLVLDEFPLVSLLSSKLEIDTERFPNFAWLSEHANWYQDAITGAEVTVDAVPEILTGKHAEPAAGKLPIAANYPANLFTLLAEDYEVTARETATLLCPRTVCSNRLGTQQATLYRGGLLADLALVWAHIVTPDPWSASLPSVSDAWSGFMAERPQPEPTDPGLEEAFAKAGMAHQMGWETRAGQFRDFINQISPSEHAQLYYLHALLPHRVWRFLPDGRQYLVEEVWAALDPPTAQPGRFGDELFGHKWQADPWAVSMARLRHLLQVQFVDTLLGELIAHLQEQGMFQDSLLVIVGDHGASFLPGHPRRAVTPATQVEISSVPMFIKLPGQDTGSQLRQQARLVDVLPTIADVLGADPDWGMDGQSLLDPRRRPVADALIRNAKGLAFPINWATNWSELGKSSAQFEKIFGLGTSMPVIGPHAKLVGKRISDFRSGPAGSGSVALDSPQLFRNVDPDGNFVPAHLSGRLESVDLSQGSLPIAIAIDDRIVSTSRTFEVPGHEREFEAMIDPAHFARGENDLSIYLVYGQGDQAFLTPLEMKAESGVQLLERDGQEYVIGPGGSETPVNEYPSAPRVLTSPVEGGGVILLNGTESGTVGQPSEMLAFLNGQFSGSAAAHEGLYRVPLVSTGVDADSSIRLRAFEYGPDGVIEFSYPEACSPNWHFAPPSHWAGISCDTAAESPLAEAGATAVLDFTQAQVRQFLDEGWDVEEGNLGWSTGQLAGVHIPLPEAAGALSMRARIKPFLWPPSLTSQRLYVLANGEQVAEFDLSNDEFKEISWDVPAEWVNLNPDSLRLTFLTPDAQSPQAVGAGGDLRILGIAFLRIEITAAQTPAPDE